MLYSFIYIGTVQKMTFLNRWIPSAPSSPFLFFFFNGHLLAIINTDADLSVISSYRLIISTISIGVGAQFIFQTVSVQLGQYRSVGQYHKDILIPKEYLGLEIFFFSPFVFFFSNKTKQNKKKHPAFNKWAWHLCVPTFLLPWVHALMSS